MEFKQRYALKDLDCAPDGDRRIKFVGVWNTVSALGFPKDLGLLIRGLEEVAN